MLYLSNLEKFNMTPEKVEQYQTLTAQKAELETELKRIDGFLARDPQNTDNGRAINAGKIFVKFAGTACKLPTGIFTGALNSRKAEITKDLKDIDAEIAAL